MKIAVTGFMLDPTGLGESARRLVAALQTVGADVSAGPILTDGGGQLPSHPVVERLLAQPRPEEPDVNLIIAAATDFPGLRIPAKRTVGYTFWETDRVHDKVAAGAATVDRLLVASHQNLQAFYSTGIRPWLVPLPALPPLEVAPLEIEEVTFVFYGIASWQERKNPTGLLVSYLTSFGEDDEVLLILKVSNRDSVLAHREIARLHKALNLGYNPPVKILAGQWSDQQIASLHARGDCYVSLSRGEACGLPMLDALAWGNRVISTDWGGQNEFLHGTGSAMLVPYHMVPVVQDYHYLSGHQRWAEPDLLEASALMQTASCVRRRLRKPEVSPMLSLESVGKTLMRALSD
jgi:glycosyltransferase involved in cell wall biosynthesis